jgi:hypothetical protein
MIKSIVAVIFWLSLCSLVRAQSSLQNPGFTPSTNNTFTNTNTFTNLLFGKNIEGVRYADLFAGTDAGAKINAAEADLPATGGTIFVPQSLAASFATGITITKPTHLIFDVGAWTFTGTGDAINVAGAVQAPIIEGSGSGNISAPTGNTSITVTSAGANGINIVNCPQFVLKNITFVGPASGTGIGAHITGNAGLVESVSIDSFGGDGWDMDGARNNANLITLKNAHASFNGGWGFSTFGVDANVITFLVTDAQFNTTGNYLFTGVSDEVLLGVHSAMATDTVGVSFVAASGTWGSLYTEPHAPFSAAAVSFDATSANNNLFLLNGRSVTDAGLGNQWYFAAPDAGKGVAGTGMTNVSTPSVSGSFSANRKIARAQSTNELTQEGIFFKNSNFTSGYTITGAGSINFVYNTNGSSYKVNFFNNCTGDYTACNPIFGLTPTGVNHDAGGFKHKRVSGCATAASLNATCDTTVAWTTAFADASYTATCTGDVVTSGVPMLEGIAISAAKTGGAITVRTISLTAAAAGFTTIDCVAAHD